MQPKWSNGLSTWLFLVFNNNRNNKFKSILMPIIPTTTTKKNKQQSKMIRLLVMMLWIFLNFYDEIQWVLLSYFIKFMCGKVFCCCLLFFIKNKTTIKLVNRKREKEKKQGNWNLVQLSSIYAWLQHFFHFDYEKNLFWNSMIIQKKEQLQYSKFIYINNNNKAT